VPRHPRGIHLTRGSLVRGARNSGRRCNRTSDGRDALSPTLRGECIPVPSTGRGKRSARRRSCRIPRRAAIRKLWNCSANLEPGERHHQRRCRQLQCNSGNDELQHRTQTHTQTVRSMSLLIIGFPDNQWPMFAYVALEHAGHLSELNFVHHARQADVGEVHRHRDISTDKTPHIP
jgi:hypothetical protein